jgi:SAM-dependent methyltransferase
MTRWQLSPQLAQVKDFWEAESCGTHYATNARYTKEYFREIEERRYRLEPFIADFAQFSRWKGKDVLEVGVGAGTDFVQFVRAGARAHGVDLTNAAVDHVRERLALEDLRAADLRQCNAEKLPHGNDQFDLVYSWGVIHHSENTEQALREIYRVAKPGGQIKIMIYNVNSTTVWLKWLHHALLRGRLNRGRRWALWHFQESLGTKGFSEFEVRRMLSTLPHSDLQVSYYDDFVQPGDKYETLFRFLRRVEPARMRWFLAFQFKKGFG